MTTITPPGGFRHHYPIQVRWGDMDALGHVNNAVYLTYLEQARVDYTRRELGLWDGAAGKLGLIMARVEIDFKLPLFAGDDVHVFTRSARLGRSSGVTEQLIARAKDDQLEIASRALITIVVYDYANNKPTPIPDEWRERIKAYEIVPPAE